MNEISNTFLLVFAGLFPVVKPLGAAPLFLSLTADRTSQQRTRLALLLALNSFWLLVGSTLFGSLILEFFGISIPVVRVAGGMLVTAMVWKLLNEGGGSSDEPLHDAADAGAANDSFYPLTLPLTVGPGAISVALTIGSHHPRDPFGAHAMLLAGAACLACSRSRWRSTAPIALPCRWCAILERPESTCWSGCRRSFWFALVYRSAGAG